ncbi:MAG TPA: gephyrin-like molybdotransferase Glp [Terriglobales bacterium]
MAAHPNSSNVLSFEVARRVVEEHSAGLRVGAVEEQALLKSVGRVLAEPIYADRDFPPFPRAARDGYALHATDLGHLPAELEVIGEIKAGVSVADMPQEIATGQAVAIMTGAPVPVAADAVVMVEYTRRQGNRVEVLRGVAAGENIVPRGSEARSGTLLLSGGSRLDEAAIAVAASVGRSRLKVYQKPRIAILATGDEIVGIEMQPAPNQIRNSNTYSLAAQILLAGAEAVPLPVARDEAAHLRKLVETGLTSDLLLLAGGVSMGEYDLVENVLAELGAEFFFTGAQIQPGRPIVFGRARDKYFFGLPGNPVSTMVTFELFARPMIEALMGLKPRKLIFLRARLKTEVKTKTGLKRFLPAVLSGEFERAQVELAGWHGSGDIAAVARANCYLVIPPDRDHIPVGEWVPVLLR